MEKKESNCQTRKLKSGYGTQDELAWPEIGQGQIFLKDPTKRSFPLSHQ
jgi:hypothetical protein